MLPPATTVTRIMRARLRALLRFMSKAFPPKTCRSRSHPCADLPKPDCPASCRTKICSALFPPVTQTRTRIDVAMRSSRYQRGQGWRADPPLLTSRRAAQKAAPGLVIPQIKRTRILWFPGCCRACPNLRVKGGSACDLHVTSSGGSRA